MLKGTFQTDKDRMLCVTIPYSKGWSAKVDGQNPKIYKANGMFMGIFMTSGEHKNRSSHKSCRMGSLGDPCFTEKKICNKMIRSYQRKKYYSKKYYHKKIL